MIGMELFLTLPCTAAAGQMVLEQPDCSQA